MSPGLSTSILSIDDADWLLSLPQLELQSWLKSMPVTQRQTVLRELMEHKTPKERAEASLFEFMRQAWHLVEPDTPFVEGWHIRAICEHLEALTNGELFNDLLINMPPGCCKSLMTSVFWPAWVWTTRPHFRWFFASYDQNLSTRDNVRCRNIIESHWYQGRWGERFRLVGDQNQKTRYDTDHRGWRLATSTGGRGTGEHPDIIVVDDPHNAKDIDSDKERQAALDWWDGTISTRGKIRNVRRAVVMQRLKESDLSGHILEKGGFVHICLPMRFESDRMQATPLGWMDPRTVDGELLWPQAFNEQSVVELERDLGSLRAAGQLQQRPQDLIGGMFKRDWFSIVDELPANAKRAVRYWDKAGTEGGGDPSAGVLITEHEGIYYIVDVQRGQWSIDKRNRIMDVTASLDRERFDVSIWVEQEPGSGGKESAEITIKRMAGYDVHAERVTGAKQTRAQPLAAQCEAGNVKLIRGPWNKAFIDEACGFPHGSHDDQIDAAGGAFNKLAKPTRKFMVA